MKTILTLFLCLSLSHTGFAQSQTNLPPIEPKGFFIVAFVLGCVAVGGYIIFQVSKAIPDQDAQVTLVLEKSDDGRATWTPIYTNTVVLHGHEPIEFFREQTTDDMAFYRVKLLK